DDSTMGKKFQVVDVPEEFKAVVEAARHELIESAVEHDDELMEKYLGGEQLTEEEIRRAVRKATLAMEFVPILCGASFKNKGARALPDAVIDYLPGPVDVSAIMGVAQDDDTKVIERHADDTETFSALACKVAADPFVGRLTYFGVYSGKLEAGSYV